MICMLTSNIREVHIFLRFIFLPVSFFCSVYLPLLRLPPRSLHWVAEVLIAGPLAAAFLVREREDKSGLSLAASSALQLIISNLSFLTHPPPHLYRTHIHLKWLPLPTVPVSGHSPTACMWLFSRASHGWTFILHAVNEHLTLELHYRSYTPLVTPFTHDEEVDWDALVKQVLRLANARMGIVLLGTNGEGEWLPY